MIRNRLLGVMPCAFAALVSVVGCGSPETAPAPQVRNGPASAPSVDDPDIATLDNPSVRLADVLATWQAGDRDGAIRQLLILRWEDATGSNDTSALGLTEEQFVSLSRDEQTRWNQEAIEMASGVRALARHALSLGDAARDAGDHRAATEYYTSAHRLGEALASPERLLLFQSMGEAVVELAQGKLSTLE